MFAEKGRCHAISQPQNERGAGGGYVSVGYWARPTVRGQVYFRLSRPKRTGSAILLRIDERTFQLRGGGVHGWALDAEADARIVSAMRVGVSMSVESRAEGGGVIRDVYRLRGAATAIDAAAIACSQQR
ncbi:MAG TPA: hypothetical protein VGB59_01740 [Allosphingosinicella sp.]